MPLVAHASQISHRRYWLEYRLER